MPENAIRPRRPFFHGLNVFCKALVLLSGGAVLLFISLLTVKNLLPELQGGDVLIYLSALAAIVLICWLILRGTSGGWGFFALVVAVAVALRLGYILSVPSQPDSDFAVLLGAARQSAAGDFSWATEVYFYNWAYQIPFVLYEGLILKLFNSVFALKMLNLAFMVGNCVLVYAIALPAGKRAALCAMLLYALYPDAVQMSSVLTNQHIATFFMLLSIALLCRGKYAAAFLSGVSLGISNLMRPEAVLIIIAAACMVIWTAAESAESGKWKKTLFSFLLLCAAYILVTKGAELILRAVNVAPNGLGNRVPEWKFALGLNFSSGGGYSDEYSYILTIKDGAQRWAETKEMIAATFAACESPLSFFANKCYVMWAQTVGEAWSNTGVDVGAPLASGAFTVGQLQHTLNVTNAALYPLIWLCALCSVPFLKKDRDDVKVFRFALIILLGFFLVFLLVEVQGRYRYCIVPLAAVLTAPIFSRLSGQRAQHREKTVKKVQNQENNA